MNGAQAWHLTGSDDFQSYVCAAAGRDGMQPAQTAAHYSAEIAETLALMDIELDQYTVTSVDPGYRDGLQAFFSRLVASGSVAPRTAAALLDGWTGDYLYEVDVSGECPGCAGQTGGNICEECGEPNTCTDLGEPRSRLSAEEPRRGEVTRHSLALHEFAEAVAEHHRLGRVPARLRELADRIFRRETLHVPITHPASWGVPPLEPAADGQVIWVWPEMAYGFLHGIESLGRRLGRQWRAAEPEADWKIVHFFGYDNSFYHAVLYPVLYRLAFPGWEPDIDYHLNEFYLLEGSKFSTSRRHAIWGKEILDSHSVDAVRYYLALTRPESRRTNFERSAYEAVVEETLIGTWQRWLRECRRARAVALRGDRARRRRLDARAHRVVVRPRHAAGRDDREHGAGRLLAEPRGARAERHRRGRGSLCRAGAGRRADRALERRDAYGDRARARCGPAARALRGTRHAPLRRAPRGGARDRAAGDVAADGHADRAGNEDRPRPRDVLRRGAAASGRSGCAGRRGPRGPARARFRGSCGRSRCGRPAAALARAARARHARLGRRGAGRRPVADRAGDGLAARSHAPVPAARGLGIDVSTEELLGARDVRELAAVLQQRARPDGSATLADPVLG